MKKPAKQAGWVAPIVAARQGKPPPAKKKPPPRTGFVAGIVAAQAKKPPARKAKQHPKAKKHPVRKLALGEGVACCSAEALAASLRLLGNAVSDDDVLELYWRTAADADAGASVLATLEAAFRFGLAGLRPMYAELQHHRLGEDAHVMLPGLPDGLGILRRMLLDEFIGLGQGALNVHALILGVDLPGPHAVLATPDGWHSWGELYDPACWPDAVIEEAWAVEWEV